MLSSALGAIADDTRDLGYLATIGWPWQDPSSDDIDDSIVEFPWSGLDGYNALKDYWRPGGAPTETTAEKERRHRRENIENKSYMCPVLGCTAPPHGDAKDHKVHIHMNHGDNNHKAMRRLTDALSRASGKHSCSYS
ncbi:hypothetical protein C1H76_2210 [Elsinoe australis]|uniref:Uncharacterized protein n=1 Tax=Elsinoe australis TaxID=40998 RepID=A0A4U7B841_9PEZI|nr:hypothetical protein C1H76_2210 [Elsinoe australis]